MKSLELNQSTMDMLDNLESIQQVADEAKQEGNYFGSESLNHQINQALDKLGLTRQVARDFGWDF